MLASVVGFGKLPRRRLSVAFDGGRRSEARVRVEEYFWAARVLSWQSREGGVASGFLRLQRTKPLGISAECSPGSGRTRTPMTLSLLTKNDGLSATKATAQRLLFPSRVSGALLHRGGEWAESSPPSLQPSVRVSLGLFGVEYRGGLVAPRAFLP